MFVVIGLAIGFVSAMPLGPISGLAISYRLNGCQGNSRTVALVAAFCDVAYTLLACFASARLTAVFDRFGPWMRLAGGVLLAGIAIAFFLKAGRLTTDAVRRGGRPSASSPAFLTFFLYVVNPTIIVYWIALIRSVTAAGYLPEGWIPRLVFANCVGIGGLVWFWVLFAVIRRSQDRISLGFFRTILRVLAAFLAILAVRNLGLAARVLFR